MRSTIVVLFLALGAVFPCSGYIVGVDVWDRTIVDSGYVGFHASASVGLCLREK